MTTFRNSIRKLIRAYPSLNLRININNVQNEVDIVLPGLRFDDIDHFGQPDIWRVYDMMNAVEAAAFYNTPNSFLDYNALLKQNYTTIVKACVVEVKKDFYEVITPKAPVEVNCKLNRVGNTSFSTIVELLCGGKMKSSVVLKNVHTIINMHDNTVEKIPEWWSKRFDMKNSSVNSIVHDLHITPVEKPRDTFGNMFMVPLSDTDITHKTRCASYFRYFRENASVASHSGFYKNIQNNFHHFHLKKLHLLYLQQSNWGDSLVSESWEDPENPLKLHCQINTRTGLNPIWYGNMELYSEVFGLETANNLN